MNPLAIIGGLGTNEGDYAISARAIQQAASSLHTPASYWIVIVVGVLASRWLVRPPRTETRHNDGIIYLASACLFIITLLAYLYIRNHFIAVYADVLESADQMLIMPMLLGSSPIGAALLILAWYYAHPIARRPADQLTGTRGILRSFAPMLMVIVIVGGMIAMSLFLRLV